jgi:large subunit ribosomal protein L10
MPMTRQAKEEMLGRLSERLNRAKAGLVADYAGLNVAAVTEIRRALRAAGVEYKVVKNKLIKRALAGTPREKLGSVFTRTTAVMFKYDTEFAKLGRTAQDLSKKFDKLKIKAGFVENDVIAEARALDVIASLPTLDEARAQLLGVINAPASKLLATMNAPGSQLLSVIQAKADKDQEKSA